MTPGAVDCAASHFKCKTPTPVHGTPTNAALKRLKLELRANAASVESDLGGDDHGCLGLVLTDLFPGTLAIPPRTDAIQALNDCEQHVKNNQFHIECSWKMNDPSPFVNGKTESEKRNKIENEGIKTKHQNLTI